MPKSKSLTSRSQSKEEDALKKKKSLLSRLKEFLVKKFFKNTNIEPEAKESFKKRSKKKGKKEVKPANSLSKIKELLKTYQQFVQDDFFMVIQETKALLRQWRSDIVTLTFSNEHIDTNLLTSNLIEIQEIYRHSETMLGRFIHNCQEYQEAIQSRKKNIAPKITVNLIEAQIEHMKRHLEKGQELIDLELDPDYKHLKQYLTQKQINNILAHRRSG